MLPKHVEKSGYVPAKWSDEEFQSAYDAADRVLRDIRAERFWPPSPNLPGYPDGLETICMDLVPDRPAIIEGSTELMVDWRFPEKAVSE